MKTSEAPSPHGRIFWVKCPGCGGRFYAIYELRHSTELKLHCPWCHGRFFADESPEIDDRA